MKKTTKKQKRKHHWNISSIVKRDSHIKRPSRRLVLFKSNCQATTQIVQVMNHIWLVCRLVETNPNIYNCFSKNYFQSITLDCSLNSDPLRGPWSDLLQRKLLPLYCACKCVYGYVCVCVCVCRCVSVSESEFVRSRILISGVSGTEMCMCVYVHVCVRVCVWVS